MGRGPGGNNCFEESLATMNIRSASAVIPARRPDPVKEDFDAENNPNRSAADCDGRCKTRVGKGETGRLVAK